MRTETFAEKCASCGKPHACVVRRSTWGRWEDPREPGWRDQHGSACSPPESEDYVWYEHAEVRAVRVLGGGVVALCAPCRTMTPGVAVGGAA